jgi:hypothetical protein
MSVFLCRVVLWVARNQFMDSEMPNYISINFEILAGLPYPDFRGIYAAVLSFTKSRFHSVASLVDWEC